MGKTRYRLLEDEDSRALTLWGLLFEIHREEEELRGEGLTEDEIADVIETRGMRADRDGDLLDHLIPEEARAERQRRRFEQEMQDAGDDEDDDG